MSEPAKTGSGDKKPLKYVAIIASLAVLGILISPVSPLSLESPPPSNPGPIDEAPQPQNISEEDVLACTSLIQGVEYIVAGGRLQPIPDEEFPEADEQQPVTFNLTAQEKLASDTLLGEFCNRPELVQNMSAAYDPTVNMVAYGCEAASGKIGDLAMQDSIADYKDIYCSSAVETIEYEAVSWGDSMMIFDEEVIPVARELASDNATRLALVDEAESITVNASDSVGNAQVLLDSGQVYDSANALDDGISMFTALLEREDMLFILES
jgi:hypothetical protein